MSLGAFLSCILTNSVNAARPFSYQPGPSINRRFRPLTQNIRWMVGKQKVLTQASTLNSRASTYCCSFAEYPEPTGCSLCCFDHGIDRPLLLLPSIPNAAIVFQHGAAVLLQQGNSMFASLDFCNQIISAHHLCHLSFMGYLAAGLPWCS